jgi:hypothetical protein
LRCSKYACKSCATQNQPESDVNLRWDKDRLRQMRFAPNWLKPLKEGAMTEQAHYPMIEWVVDKVTTAMAQHRRRVALREMEALGCEMPAIARDLGLTELQLRALALQEPGVPKHLKRMVAALEIADTFESADSTLSRDMQSLCSLCGSKRRCERELRGGTASQTFHEFCPNATNLSVLRESSARAAYPIKHKEFCPNPNIFP